MCKCLSYLYSFFTRKVSPTGEEVPLLTNLDSRINYTGEGITDYGRPKNPQKKGKYAEQEDSIAPFFAKASTSEDSEYTPLSDLLDTENSPSMWEICENALGFSSASF